MENEEILSKIQKGLNYEKGFVSENAYYSSKNTYYNGKGILTKVYLGSGLAIDEIIGEKDELTNEMIIDEFNNIKRIQHDSIGIKRYYPNVTPKTFSVITFNHFIPQIITNNTYEKYDFENKKYCLFDHNGNVILSDYADRIEKLEIFTKANVDIKDVKYENTYTMTTNRKELIELLNIQRELLKGIWHDKGKTIESLRKLFDNNHEITCQMESVCQTIEDLGPLSNAKQYVLK